MAKPRFDETVNFQPKKLTEKECLAIGGHCFETAGYQMATDPPISVRVCKHCGKTQHGRPQESMRWE